MKPLLTMILGCRDAFVVIGVVSTAAIVVGIAYYVHKRRHA